MSNSNTERTPPTPPDNFTSAEQPRKRDQREDNAELDEIDRHPPNKHPDDDHGEISVGTPDGGA